LIGSHVIEYAWTMALDDDNYVLDPDGKSVLVGLTLDENREFECLDELISCLDPVSPVSTDDGRSLNERRWLVPYEKHEAAFRPFSTTQKRSTDVRFRPLPWSWCYVG
jgi:hypothetical protein